MKVLVISSSPRKNGNTELLLHEIIKGIEDAGGKIRFIRLQDLEICPCRECLRCHKNGRCVINDDMQTLYTEIINMDAMVFGSPIFFMSISAQGKTFIDRCQPFWAMKYLLKKSFIHQEKPPRKGIFVSVGATEFPYLFDGAVRVVKSLFKVIEVEYQDELLIRKIDEKGQILKYPEVMKLGYKMGVRFVNLYKNTVRSY